MGHLGAAVNAGAQAQRDEALDGVCQLRVLQVVVEDAGRARMRQHVAVPLLQPARWKPPVPLCRPLHNPHQTACLTLAVASLDYNPPLIDTCQSMHCAEGKESEHFDIDRGC